VFALAKKIASDLKLKKDDRLFVSSTFWTQIWSEIFLKIRPVKPARFITVVWLKHLLLPYSGYLYTLSIENHLTKNHLLEKRLLERLVRMIEISFARINICPKQYLPAGPLRWGTEGTSYPRPASGGPESHKQITLSCSAQLSRNGSPYTTRKSEDFCFGERIFSGYKNRSIIGQNFFLESTPFFVLPDVTLVRGPACQNIHLAETAIARISMAELGYLLPGAN